MVFVRWMKSARFFHSFVFPSPPKKECELRPFSRMRRERPWNYARALLGQTSADSHIYERVLPMRCDNNGGRHL